MPTPVKMPRLGESVAEGTIGGWLKKEGDWVERDESLAEIITDKINAELPSPVEGRLVKILVQVDETVAVGTDIALIEAEVSANVQAEPVMAPARQNAVPATVGNGTSAAPARGHEEERQRISPLARRLAREHDLDLNAIAGTGTGGRVRKEDILAYIAQREHAPVAAPAVSTPAGPQALPSAPVLPGADEELLTPSRMRLAIAEHMVRSKRTSPHATAIVEIDMTAIARWLEKQKEEFKRRNGYSISFVPFVIKAVCEGIRQFPVLNSTWTPANTIIIKKRIHMGLAVATDEGLVVPTIYDADQYTLAGLSRQIANLAQKARNKKLTLQDMQNSTFVVNNTGTFGTILSIPIINQPHAGILSMNAVVKRPVVIEDDAIAVRSMMYLCLSFDHRILDGAESGGFLKVVREKLESYGRDIDVY
ncbi:MAG TPA: dihydrolipoamide acetyltransferase family protein [Ktedonobacteraceae bacterium]|jgi:2-oxoglutarate dehydrogenase complex dihydrolipoamide succinyltransferase (E2) component